jgi:beta-glucosidase
MIKTSSNILRRSAAVLCVLFSGLLATAPDLHAQTAPAGPDAVRRARALLGQMTVEEKVGQLNLAGGSVLPGRPRLSDDMIVQGKVGSVLWLADPHEIDRIQHLAVEKSRLHIPILFGLDVVHGYETMFPIPLAMASSWDPSVEHDAQAFAAREARAAGIRWTFTPMVDIARDARWGRIEEGAGEDPYLGAAMAQAQIRGFQGDALGAGSVVACAKHFAGYGAAEGGRDYDAAYIPEVLLRNVYLKPFYAAVEAGVGSLMSAYMDLNDVPASGNRWLLTDLLRGEWGFQGFLTSDAGAIANLQAHGYAADPADAAFKAITAGAGIDMASQTFTNHLPALIAQGRVKESLLDAAVLPVLAVKYQLGLFDHPYVQKPEAADGAAHAAGLALARKLAARSMVLLKNANTTLPLSRSLRKIAIVGYLADSGFDTQGGPSAGGAFTRVEKYSPVSVLAALRARLGPDEQISYVPGPALARDTRSTFEVAVGYPAVRKPTPAEVDEWLEKTRAAASNADVVIAVLGETAFMDGEEGSRATLDLPGIQERMLEVAASTGKPVVVVLINGRPVDIRWAAEHAAAIVEAWFPGVAGGDAVADVLFGDVNPGGKLPLSWPRTAGQEPLYYNHNLTHHPEDAPNFTSRYWDLSSFPLYRFGYGLSYTTFRYTNLRLVDAHIRSGGSTQVSVDVTNIGALAGDTVGQLYIHQRSGTASRPARQLAGFQRIALRPGETRTLVFTLGREELSFWSPQTRHWSAEPGVFDLWAGDDSNAALQTQLTVTEP